MTMHCRLIGILPGVMRLLQEASRAIAGVKSREKLIATQRDKLPSYTALAFSSFLPHSMLSAQSNVDYSKVQGLYEAMKLLIRGYLA
jgi:hypothetical protein